MKKQNTYEIRIKNQKTRRRNIENIGNKDYN